MNTRSFKGLGTPYQIAYSLAFSLAFITYFMRRFLAEQDFLYLASASLVVSGGVLLAYLFLRGWRVQSVVACIATAIFLFLMPYSFYTMNSVSDFSIISFFLLSAAVDKTDQQLMNTLFSIKLAVAALVLGAYLYKVIPDVTTVRQYQDYELTRHSYGFMHPNSLGMYFVSLLFDVAMMHKKRTISSFLLATVGALLIYSITNSRTALFLSISCLFLILFQPLLVKVKVHGAFLVVALVAIFSAGIGLSNFYDIDNAQYESINKLLSNRLRSAHAYIEEYGFSLYPRTIKQIKWMNDSIVYNENFYVDSLLRQGIVVFSLFPIVLIAQLFNKKYSLYHSLLFLLCLVSAMMEDYGVSLLICSPLLLQYVVSDRQEHLEA